MHPSTARLASTARMARARTAPPAPIAAPTPRLAPNAPRTLSRLADPAAAMLAPVAHRLSQALPSALVAARLASTGAALNVRPALPVSTPRLARRAALTALMIPTRLPALAPAHSALLARDVAPARPASTSALISAPTARFTLVVAARTARPVPTPTTTCAPSALLVPSPTRAPSLAPLAPVVPFPRLTARPARPARATPSPTATTALLARLVPLLTPARALAVPSLPGVPSPFSPRHVLPESSSAPSFTQWADLSALTL